MLSFTFAVLALSFSASCRTPSNASVAEASSRPGECAYFWPAVERSPSMDHDGLEREIHLYAKKTGNCINGPESGLSRESYRDLQHQRNSRFRKVDATRGGGATPARFCSAVRYHFVQTPYDLEGRAPDACPRQFAACGEGVRVGACLAYQFGFSSKEILLCNNLKKTFDPSAQHEFTLVPDLKGNGWCVVDRFSRVGNFKCGVELDQSRGEILVDGEVVDDPWFRNVQCESLESHVSTPSPSPLF